MGAQEHGHAWHAGGERSTHTWSARVAARFLPRFHSHCKAEITNDELCMDRVSRCAKDIIELEVAVDYLRGAYKLKQTGSLNDTKKGSAHSLDVDSAHLSGVHQPSASICPR